MKTSTKGIILILTLIMVIALITLFVLSAVTYYQLDEEEVIRIHNLDGSVFRILIYKDTFSEKAIKYAGYSLASVILLVVSSIVIFIGQAVEDGRKY